MTTIKSPHNTPVAAELSAATDQAGIYCSVVCKYGRRDAKDMVRCSLCYTWYHEDCVDDHYNHTTDSHWWLCGKCRQMPHTLVTLNDTVLQLSGYVSQLVDQNKILTEMINELKQSKSNIKAELTSIQISKDLDRNPRVISSDHGWSVAINHHSSWVTRQFVMLSHMTNATYNMFALKAVRKPVTSYLCLQR